MQQALVLHHLKTEDLPPEWATRLPAGQTFTITITPEKQRQAKRVEQASPYPLFGIWRDNPAAQDVDAYVRQLRKGRFHAR